MRHRSGDVVGFLPSESRESWCPIVDGLARDSLAWWSGHPRRWREMRGVDVIHRCFEACAWWLQSSGRIRASWYRFCMIFRRLTLSEVCVPGQFFRSSHRGGSSKSGSLWEHCGQLDSVAMASTSSSLNDAMKTKQMIPPDALLVFLLCKVTTLECSKFHSRPRVRWCGLAWCGWFMWSYLVIDGEGDGLAVWSCPGWQCQRSVDRISVMVACPCLQARPTRYCTCHIYFPRYSSSAIGRTFSRLFHASKMRVKFLKSLSSKFAIKWATCILLSLASDPLPARLVAQAQTTWLFARVSGPWRNWIRKCCKDVWRVNATRGIKRLFGNLFGPCTAIQHELKFCFCLSVLRLPTTSSTCAPSSSKLTEASRRHRT